MSISGLLQQHSHPQLEGLNLNGNHLFERQYYQNFNQSNIEVYRLKPLGAMIMLIECFGCAREMDLPDSFSGHTICFAVDKGDGRINLSGTRMVSNNRIKLSGRSDTNAYVFIMGQKNW